MQVSDSISTLQVTGTPSVDKTPDSSGWKPGKIDGKIASALGFKANEQQQDLVAQNDDAKKAIEDEIAKIDKEIAKQLQTEKFLLSTAKPLMAGKIKSQYKTSLRDLAQQKGELVFKLANEDYTLPQKRSSTLVTPSSSTTTSRTRSPTIDAQATKNQAELEQYQQDKKQVTTNKKLLEGPATSRLYTTQQRAALEQDSQVRQKRISAYEKAHPEVLKNNS